MLRSADYKLWRVFTGVMLCRWLRRLRMSVVSHSFSADVLHVHVVVCGLLIFWKISFTLSVRVDCLSLNHMWFVILFTIVSTSDIQT